MDKVILSKISYKILFFMFFIQFLTLNGMLVKKQKTKLERELEKPNMMAKLGQDDPKNFSFLKTNRISPKKRLSKEKLPNVAKACLVAKKLLSKKTSKSTLKPDLLSEKTSKNTLKPTLSIASESNGSCEDLDILNFEEKSKEVCSIEKKESFDSLLSFGQEEEIHPEIQKEKDVEKTAKKPTLEALSRPSSPCEKQDMLKKTAKFFASVKQLEVPELHEKQKLPSLVQEQAKPKKTKSSKELLKKVNIDFKILRKKRILNVEGLVFFCDTRNFTCFSNECENPSDPASFMAEITKLAEGLARKWGSYVIGIAGDAHLVFFPKFKSEKNYSLALKNCFLCAIEFVIKSIELMKKYTQQHYPKQCDLGIETGTVCFYALEKNEILKFAATSKTINNAQCYEDDAKKSDGLNKRKITLTEQNFIQLKELKELFGPKHLLNAKGIKGHPFVYSCPLEEIKAFYESADWENHKSEVMLRNKEKKPIENFERLLKIFKAIHKNKQKKQDA